MPLLAAFLVKGGKPVSYGVHFCARIVVPVLKQNDMSA